MNGIAKITIDDQKVALKFGMPAVRRIAEKMIEYGILEKDIYGDLGLSHLLYAGYYNDCLMRDRLPSIPFERFYEYVETPLGETTTEVAEVIKVFADSKYIKEEIDKKKATMTTLSPSTGTE